MKYLPFIFMILIITLLILLFVSSCNRALHSEGISSVLPQGSQASNTSTFSQLESGITQTSSPNTSQVFSSGTEASVLSRINNDLSKEQLIKKTLDIDFFIQKYCKNPYATFRGNPPSIAQVEADFGIECIRKTDAGTLYSMHKVNQGGFLYIFYKTRISDGKKEYEEIYNWIYVKKNLSYKDFTSIKEGTSVEDVEAIDPVTTVYKNRMYNYDTNEKKPISYSMHYLKDGILTIFYTYKDGKYKVGSQEFKKDFQFDKYFYSAMQPYDGHVLPKDILS